MKQITYGIIAVILMAGCEKSQSNQTDLEKATAQADSLRRELDQRNSSDDPILTYENDGFFPQIGMFANREFTSEEIRSVKQLSAFHEGKLGVSSYGQAGDAVAIPMFVRIMSMSEDIKQMNAKIASCGPQTHADSLYFVNEFLKKNPEFAKEIKTKIE